nr:hypothetical protein [uncultured Roseateles sp.]
MRKDIPKNQRPMCWQIQRPAGLLAVLVAYMAGAISAAAYFATLQQPTHAISCKPPCAVYKLTESDDGTN